MADAMFVYVLFVGLLAGFAGSLRWRWWAAQNVTNRLMWLGAAALNLAWTVAAAELLLLPRPLPPIGFRWYIAALGSSWLVFAISYQPVHDWIIRRRKETP